MYRGEDCTWTLVADPGLVLCWLYFHSVFLVSTCWLFGRRRSYFDHHTCEPTYIRRHMWRWRPVQKDWILWWTRHPVTIHNGRMLCTWFLRSRQLVIRIVIHTHLQAGIPGPITSTTPSLTIFFPTDAGGFEGHYGLADKSMNIILQSCRSFILHFLPHSMWRELHFSVWNNSFSTEYVRQLSRDGGMYLEHLCSSWYVYLKKHELQEHWQALVFVFQREVSTLCLTSLMWILGLEAGIADVTIWKFAQVIFDKSKVLNLNYCNPVLLLYF